VTIDRPREAEAITTTLARLLRVKAHYDRGVSSASANCCRCADRGVC
jgi:hypothetical protein